MCLLQLLRVLSLCCTDSRLDIKLELGSAILNKFYRFWLVADTSVNKLRLQERPFGLACVLFVGGDLQPWADFQIEESARHCDCILIRKILCFSECVTVLRLER